MGESKSGKKIAGNGGTDFDDEEMAALKKHLEFLSSDAGYEWSNSYDYISNPLLPMDC